MMPTALRWMIIAVLALVTASVAKAEYVDLRGGMQITQPMRCDEEVPQVCVIVTKDEKEYLVVIDAKGERKLYEIIKDTPVLIWDRETI